MTKSEAIMAMRNGEKLTHENFASYEWVTCHDKMNYIFEDGVICPDSEFWHFRQDEYWNDGWSIFQEKHRTDFMADIIFEGNSYAKSNNEWVPEVGIETGAESLAFIQADTAKKAFIAGAQFWAQCELDESWHLDENEAAESYARQLRQQSTNGSNGDE